MFIISFTETRQWTTCVQNLLTLWSCVAETDVFSVFTPSTFRSWPYAGSLMSRTAFIWNADFHWPQLSLHISDGYWKKCVMTHRHNKYKTSSLNTVLRYPIDKFTHTYPVVIRITQLFFHISSAVCATSSFVKMLNVVVTIYIINIYKYVIQVIYYQGPHHAYFNIEGIILFLKEERTSVKLLFTFSISCYELLCYKLFLTVMLSMLKSRLPIMKVEFF